MNVTMTNGFIFQIINLLMVSWGGGGYALPGWTVNWIY